MKYSNFQVIKEVGGTLFATVDVALWLWGTKRITIFKKREHANFRQLKTGQFTEGCEVENLYAGYKAAQLLEKSA